MPDPNDTPNTPPPDMPEPAESTELDSTPVDGGATAKAAEDDFLANMMAGNFIEYASYVIKERAIPDVDDGLKPVQRRILHSLHQIDDGRFHKVANVIGHTMQYHPHGDASIGSALVVLANKEFYIDKQGNFGNIHTGDAASAARYIECRLTPLARDILFNPEITEFEDSYDGRNREPVRLPAKLPSLLMLGADGIAVGMSTRILPHNFNELIDAQIAILRGKAKPVYPDFLTGGLMDVGEYADGTGKVKVRARIEIVDDKTLVIREVPAGTTTESLMGNIEDAVRHGKIKIAQIKDYTAENVEIEIKLPRGMYAKETIKRLYAYTDCEVNISSSIMVICENEPVMMTVSEILQRNADKLQEYLHWELQIRLGRLNEAFHAKTLAQIFIENRIYKRIEDCESWQAVLDEVHAGLEPFSDQFRREVTDEDIERLLQLQIRRISKFDLDKNRQELDDILRQIEETRDNLENLTRYAVDYLKKVKKTYGKEFPRHTEITDLGEVDARQVALKNLRVGHDRQNNFVGTEVKNSNKSE
ncbi:MAG: DNA topoisomerase IV subunit A, partial [Verrucomicrobiota bacterium]